MDPLPQRERLAARPYLLVTMLVSPMWVPMSANVSGLRCDFFLCAAHPDYLLIGLPAVEIYRATRINPAYALNHTEILLPIAKKGR